MVSISYQSWNNHTVWRLSRLHSRLLSYSFLFFLNLRKDFVHGVVILRSKPRAPTSLFLFRVAAVTSPLWHFVVGPPDSDTFPITHRDLSRIKRSRLLLSKTGSMLSSWGERRPSKCSVISLTEEEAFTYWCWENAGSILLDSLQLTATVPSLCNRTEGVTVWHPSYLL